MNLVKLISSISGNVTEFIFPRCCYLCGSRLSVNEKYICSLCESRLPRTHYHRIDMNRMEQRFAGKFPFVHASGHFFYSSNSDLSILMQDLKYRKSEGLAKHLGTIVGKELFSTPFLTDIDAISPIPMHFIKKARRGYNQTEIIARGISEITGIRIIYNLRAIKSHKTQTAMTHEQRLKNTAGIFGVKNPEELSNKHILLLDDVCTTGSTLTSAANALLASNPTIRLSLLTIGVTA